MNGVPLNVFGFSPEGGFQLLLVTLPTSPFFTHFAHTSSHGFLWQWYPWINQPYSSYLSYVFLTPPRSKKGEGEDFSFTIPLQSLFSLSGSSSEEDWAPVWLRKDSWVGRLSGKRQFRIYLEAMYIKQVVIDGFKSYATRTTINGFDPLFNAITGLNGSGKSNILDSICFLLGISNLTQVSNEHVFIKDNFTLCPWITLKQWVVVFLSSGKGTHG